jgi:hypothetical protein
MSETTISSGKPDWNPKKGKWAEFLLQFPFTFVFQLGAAGIFMGERNQFPRAVPKRSLEDVRVLVIAKDAKITGLLAEPTIHHGAYLYAFCTQHEPGWAFLAFGVGVRFNGNLQDRLSFPRNRNDLI